VISGAATSSAHWRREDLCQSQPAGRQARTTAAATANRGLLGSLTGRAASVTFREFSARWTSPALTWRFSGSFSSSFKMMALSFDGYLDGAEVARWIVQNRVADRHS